MFTIAELSVPEGTTSTLTQVLPQIGAPMQGLLNIMLGQNDAPGTGDGPGRAQYQLAISGLGALTIRDTGDVHKGASWSVQINGSDYWYYEGVGKMNISISTQGVATISGPVNTVAVPLIPNFSAAALATVSSVATAVCDQIQSKRSMGENNPLLVAMANDPIAVLTQNGLPAGLLAGVPQASKDNLISYLSSEANGEIAALRKRQVPRGFARCWACRIGFGVAFAIAGVVLTAATWGAAAPLFATAAAYMTMYLAIAASTAEGILVAAGGTASAGGIGALIEFICEAIPSTC